MLPGGTRKGVWSTRIGREEAKGKFLGKSQMQGDPQWRSEKEIIPDFVRL